MYGSIAGHHVEGIETCAISHVLVSFGGRQNLPSAYAVEIIEQKLRNPLYYFYV